MSGSQLTSSVKRGSPTLSTSASVAGAGSRPTCSRVAQRSARLSSRAPRSSSSASATVLGERQPEPPAALLGDRGEVLGQLARDRLQHERAAPVEPRRADAPDPAAASPPRASRVTSGGRVSAGKRSEHALDVRRRRVGLRRPPLLRVPVEAAAGDRAHGIDDVGAVGEREHDVVVPVPVGAELDVVGGLHETHGTVHGSAPASRCLDACAWPASTARSRPRRRGAHPGRRRGPAARRRRLRGAPRLRRPARSRSDDHFARLRAHLRRPAARGRSRRAARRGRWRCSSAPASRSRCCGSSSRAAAAGSRSSSRSGAAADARAWRR